MKKPEGLCIFVLVGYGARIPALEWLCGYAMQLMQTKALAAIFASTILTQVSFRVA